MKRVKVIPLLFTVAFLMFFRVPAAGALVFSFHPVSDEKNTYFDPRLLGTWGVCALVDLSEGRSSEDLEELGIRAHFEKVGNGYLLTLAIQRVEIEMEARLVRIWGENWLELSPTEDAFSEFIEENLVNPLLAVELYHFLKVEELGPDLVLSVMDPGWALERLQTESRQMDFAHRGGLPLDRIYLTSKPHELKPYLSRIGRFREALPRGIRMKRIRGEEKTGEP